jgi:ubiquinone biosynthesis protein UbiJ
MDFGELIPIVAILATAGVIVNFLQYLQSRHASRRADAGSNVMEAAENARLARDNDKLRLTVDRLEARLAVLERIATDPAERTAREIEQLR